MEGSENPMTFQVTEALKKFHFGVSASGSSILHPHTSAQQMSYMLVAQVPGQCDLTDPLG